jgi:hypothetical protein
LIQIRIKNLCLLLKASNGLQDEKVMGRGVFMIFTNNIAKIILNRIKEDSEHFREEDSELDKIKLNW